MIFRAIVAAAAAAWFVAAAVLVSGGISFRVGGVLIRSHSALIPIGLATALTLIAVVRRTEARAALAWWWNAIEHRSGPFTTT